MPQTNKLKTFKKEERGREAAPPTNMSERRIKTGTLSAAGSVTLPLSGNPLVFVGLTGTYGTAVGQIEGTVDGTNWFFVPAIKCDSGFAREGSLALVDNSTNGFYVPASSLAQVRYKLTSIASGTVAVQLCNSDAVDLPVKAFNAYQATATNVAKLATAVAAGSGAADVVVAASGPGILHRLVVTTAGTAVISIYDHPSASSGAKLLYSSAATYALGTVTELNIPFELGLVAVQANGSAAVTVGYSLL